MRLIKYIAFNTGFALFVYYGLFEGVEGAGNAAIFFAWTLGILSLFVMNDDVIKKHKEKGFSVPYWVDASFDLGITVAFVWCGYFWTAGIYFFHLLMIAGLRAKVEEENEQH